MSEQRHANRLNVNDGYTRIDDFVAEYVSNVSRTGVFIRTRDLLPIGTEVQLRFSIFLDDFETIEGEGRVVRVVDDSDEPGMGVEFVSLTDASRDLLERLHHQQQQGRPQQPTPA